MSIYWCQMNCFALSHQHRYSRGHRARRQALSTLRHHEEVILLHGFTGPRQVAMELVKFIAERRPRVLHFEMSALHVPPGNAASNASPIVFVVEGSFPA
jgi:hypothetical protein